MKLVNLIIGIIFLFLINCATFTDFNPEIKEVEFKKTENATKSILINVKQKIIINEKEIETNSNAVENSRKKFAEICKESFLFKEVKTGLDRADMKLVIELENRGENNPFLSFLTGFTLFLIPSYAKDDVYYKFQFKDNKDVLIKEYKRQATYNTWVQIFLLPIMPFKFPIVTHINGNEDITKSVLDEANKDGLFK